MTHSLPEAVQRVFNRYPAHALTLALELRAMIFDEATHRDVGPLLETLKWGQPAYLTHATRAGTTLRLHWSEKIPTQMQMLVHCQTDLVSRWHTHFPDLHYAGNRAVLLELDAPVPKAALRSAIGMALTYHRDAG